MPEQMTDYFLARTGERSVRGIAARAGLDPSTTARQLSGTSDLKVQTVVAIARAYSISIGELFVAAGFITQIEASLLGIQQALEAATEEQLLGEMLRRVAEGKVTNVSTGAVPAEMIEQAFDNVRQLRPNDGGYLDDAIKEQGYETAAGTDETQADEFE